ncbi:BlaI/MecI/CopY family transcriptional regulator [Opitutaceae bacterium EW11]|nr:BlaI/MecI/CopY family transcriptional regulator [Opitutaceae bacterium EW11]
MSNMSSGKDEATPRPNELTAAEWEVMKVVWERQPCSAGDVQEALKAERGWAYSTVKTTMDRLAKKGVLALKRVRNVQLFEARITRTDAARGEIRRLLDRAFDGAVAPMVNHLVAHEKLAPGELAALRRLIESAETERNV